MICLPDVIFFFLQIKFEKQILQNDFQHKKEKLSCNAAVYIVIVIFRIFIGLNM